MYNFDISLLKAILSILFGTSMKVYTNMDINNVINPN